MAETPPSGIQTLIGDALREGSNLAQKEIALFRTEMSGNVRALGLGVGMMVCAGAFLVAAIILLTQSLVKWLATIVQSEALAALIVAVGTLVVAAGLALWARSTMSVSTLVPTRTGRQVRQDARVLSERISG
jgi:hypothetical protein